MPARAAWARSRSCTRPRRRRLASRRRNRGHRALRSTSTRPSVTTSARKDRSAAASSSRTTSTGRPMIAVSFALRSTTRSRLGSRRSTSRSTSLIGVSVPAAADPNSSAKRTFCSVRRALRKAESSDHERPTYRRSDSGSSRVRGVGLTARRVPWFTARRSVRSFAPTSSASRANSVMCPLYWIHVSNSNTVAEGRPERLPHAGTGAEGSGRPGDVPPLAPPPARRLRRRRGNEVLELDVVAVEGEAHALLGELVRFLIAVRRRPSSWAPRVTSLPASPLSHLIGLKSAQGG